MFLDISTFATMQGIILTIGGVFIKYLLDKSDTNNDKKIKPLEEKIIILETNFANEQKISLSHKLECDTKHTETEVKLAHQSDITVQKLDTIMSIVMELKVALAKLEGKNQK